MKQLLFLLILVGALCNCVGPAPIDDYNYAYTALESSRAVKAAKFAPGYFNQAEDFYRKALADYEDRRYEQAKANFKRAREFAEKAENYTVLKKAQTGEVD